MITIRANDEGFFNLSPLNAPIAPNVFLGTGVNVDGTIAQGAGGEWMSVETYRYLDFGIEVTVTASALPDAQAGTTAQINVETVTFFRMEDGVRVEFASIDMPEDFTVTAWYDTLGAGPELVWQADFGDALAAAISQQGFEFIGGDGDDIFAPHSDIFPIRKTTLIDGGAGNDQITGTFGNDRILGGSGDDVLFDERGHNVLSGGSGNDTISLGYASDHSRANGGWGHDTLISSIGSDRLFGNQGRDTLLGGSGNDRLAGGAGTDRLDGGDGNDILIGGRGKDVMTGGEDADMFVFGGASGRDRITDFDADEDHIAFRNSDGMDDLTLVQLGDDLQIIHDNGSILLENFHIADVTEDMFIFG